MDKTAKIQNINTVKSAGDRTGINWLFVLQGTLILLAVLVMIGFWGTFAYSMITGNVKLAMVFGQVISVVVGVAVPIMILKKLYEHLSKK